jgi:hypothetical protein
MYTLNRCGGISALFPVLAIITSSFLKKGIKMPGSIEITGERMV